MERALLSILRESLNKRNLNYYKLSYQVLQYFYMKGSWRVLDLDERSPVEEEQELLLSRQNYILLDEKNSKWLFLIMFGAVMLFLHALFPLLPTD